MGVGEYLSSSAEQTSVAQKLISLEKKVKNERSKVFNEFSILLKEKGEKEYKKVTSYLMDTPEVLISLQGVKKYDYNAVTLGMACFISFLLFGAVPILFFFVFDGSFVSSVISSLISLTALGLVEIRKRKSYVFQVLFLSTVCGFISYYVSIFVESL